MLDRLKLPLDELVGKIIEQLNDAGFSSGTIVLYERLFGRLKKMANKLGKEVFDQELALQFIEDNAYRRGGGYCHSRYLYHVRCVRFIESYISDGAVDFSITNPLPPKELKNSQFRLCHAQFKDWIVNTFLDNFFKVSKSIFFRAQITKRRMNPMVIKPVYIIR